LYSSGNIRFPIIFPKFLRVLMAGDRFDGECVHQPRSPSPTRCPAKRLIMKKLGLNVTSEKDEKRGRIYRSVG